MACKREFGVDGFEVCIDVCGGDDRQRRGDHFGLRSLSMTWARTPSTRSQELSDAHLGRAIAYASSFGRDAIAGATL